MWRCGVVDAQASVANDGSKSPLGRWVCGQVQLEAQNSQDGGDSAGTRECALHAPGASARRVAIVDEALKQPSGRCCEGHRLSRRHCSNRSPEAADVGAGAGLQGGASSRQCPLWARHGHPQSPPLLGHLRTMQRPPPVLRGQVGEALLRPSDLTHQHRPLGSARSGGREASPTAQAEVAVYVAQASPTSIVLSGHRMFGPQR